MAERQIALPPLRQQERNHADPTISCWTSLRTGEHPANVARARKRVREIGTEVDRRSSHTTRGVYNHRTYAARRSGCADPNRNDAERVQALLTQPERKSFAYPAQALDPYASSVGYPDERIILAVFAALVGAAIFIIVHAIGWIVRGFGNN